MKLWEVIIVSVGLALNELTIAVCKGSTQRRMKKSTTILVGLIFGAIKTIMLAAGMIIAIYPMLNIQSEEIISINQWFSAIILFYLGVKFFRNAFKSNNSDERREEFFGYKGSVDLALVASLDTLILGIGLGLLRTGIISNIVILFIITTTLVVIGLWIGYFIGNKYKRQIDICGGIILLGIGIKIICNYFNII